MAGGGIAPTGPVTAYEGKTTVYVVLASVIAASGGLMFGYDIGISGGVTSMDGFLRKFFPEVLRKMSAARQTNYCLYDNQKLQAFTSSLYISGLVFTFAASFTSRKYGRRTTMRLAALAFVIGVTLCAAAPELITLIVGRVFLGVGVGFANQAVPLYLAEMAPTHLRGALNILFQLAVTLGILLANIINYFTNKIDGWGWRVSLGLAGVPAVLLAVGGLILPDTPNSLIERGRFEEGRRVLQKVRGVTNVDAEYDDIVAACEFAKRIKHPFRQILNKRNRPQLIISFFLQLFQQFTGINAIEFYAPVLFKTLGFGSGAALYSAVIIGVVNSASTFVAVYLVDKIGRRKLLLQAGVQMGISQLVVGILLGLLLKNTGSLSNTAAIIVVVFICLFVASFAWSWGPLGWLIPSETFPLETRSLGLSFTVSTNLFFTFVIAQSFLSMLCSLKYGIFLFFTAWIVVMTICVIFFLPETKGIPIEDMQEIWAKHRVWRHVVPRSNIEGQEMKSTNGEDLKSPNNFP